MKNTPNTSLTLGNEESHHHRTPSQWGSAFILLTLIALLLSGSFWLTRISASKNAPTASPNNNSPENHTITAYLTKAREAIAATEKKRTPSPSPSKPTKKITTDAPATKSHKKSKPAQRKPPAKWPRLTVSGFGKPTGPSNNGFAIINGQNISVNGYIDGAKLLEVRDLEIVMEFDGETNTINSLNQN